jgi:hypothetical protein
VERPALVTEVALQLPEDRRNGIAEEGRAAVRLEPVDGLDEADARYLHEVLVGLVGVRVARSELARERDESLDELIPRGQVAVPVIARQQALVAQLAEAALAARSAARAGASSGRLRD